MGGMQFYGKKVCFIGAHPDDIELGCGALIARISGKTDVRCVTFSNNQKNPLLKNLVEEHYASMQTLGVPRERVDLLDFETRRFQEHRQEILEAMIGIMRQDDPDIVFVHTKSDVHQDHGKTAICSAPCEGKLAASIADSAADFNRELPKSALGVYPEGLWGYYLKGSRRYYPERSWGYTPSEARGYTPLSRLGLPLQAVWVYPSMA